MSDGVFAVWVVRAARLAQSADKWKRFQLNDHRLKVGGFGQVRTESHCQAKAPAEEKPVPLESDGGGAITISAATG